MACYARRDQEWTFFEINPDIEMVARNPRLFTFLSDCAPNARVVLGDARLSLALMPDGAYDVIALDVFSSDAIPIHLLTRDALALYLRKLRPDGVLFLHISNRYLDLVPVVAALARDAGVVAMAKSDTDRKVGLWPAGKQPSIWAVIGRNDKSLRPLASMTQWKTITPDFDAQAWTDDFSNLFSALRPALY
jgi:SAM-dependent methyltransferase